MKFSYMYLLLVIYLLSGYQQPLFSQTISSSIKDLSEGSDLILTGKVVEQTAQWNSDRTMISTNVTIQVDEYLKGTGSGSRIVVTHPGGEIGSVGEYYSHIPRFADNESVLVFLKQHDTDRSFRVYEGESGKISLIEDTAAGEKVTSRHTKLSELKKEISRSLQRQ